MRNTYFAHSDEAMIDLDSDKAYRLFLERLPKVLPLIKKLIILATRPHHFHVYLRLKKWHRFVDISALQTYLGSDKYRELANMSRIIAGASLPILLIEFSRLKHWRAPDIVCSCPPKWKGRKLGNCRHLMSARGHQARYGFLSTRLRIIGVSSPFET